MFDAAKTSMSEWSRPAAATYPVIVPLAAAIYLVIVPLAAEDSGSVLPDL